MSRSGAPRLPAPKRLDTTILFAAFGILCSLAGCRKEVPHVGASHQRSSAGDAGSTSPASPSNNAGASRSDTVEPTCGLSVPKRIELMPMLRDKLVVAQSLHATKLHGSPRLINEPDDFEMYYLAQSAIDESSVPSQVQALVGNSVTFVNAPHCQANVGKLSVWAWADKEGTGWKGGNAAWNAARAFRDGDSFLVGELLGLNCSQKYPMGATRNLPAHFHAWQVLTLSDEARNEERVQLMQKGLVALNSEPALAVANQRYERLRHNAAEPLPEHWWLLPRSYISWSLATDGDAALLIVELQSQPMVAKLQFSAAWLGIWCIGTGGKLQSLGLDYVPDELSDTISNYRHHLEVAGAPGEMPLILYSNYALRPEAPRGGSSATGAYEVYQYALARPPRLD